MGKKEDKRDRPSKDHDSGDGYLDFLEDLLIFDDDCFIATTVYGNRNHPNVNVLRQFRDEVLNQNPLGRTFVTAYYSGLGKKAAEMIEQRIPTVIPLIKVGLDYLVDHYSKCVE